MHAANETYRDGSTDFEGYHNIWRIINYSFDVIWMNCYTKRRVGLSEGFPVNLT